MKDITCNTCWRMKIDFNETILLFYHDLMIYGNINFISMLK